MYSLYPFIYLSILLFICLAVVSALPLHPFAPSLINVCTKHICLYASPHMDTLCTLSLSPTCGLSFPISLSLSLSLATPFFFWVTNQNLHVPGYAVQTYFSLGFCMILLSLSLSIPFFQFSFEKLHASSLLRSCCLATSISRKCLSPSRPPSPNTMRCCKSL